MGTWRPEGSNVFKILINAEADVGGAKTLPPHRTDQGLNLCLWLQVQGSGCFATVLQDNVAGEDVGGLRFPHFSVMDPESESWVLSLHLWFCPVPQHGGRDSVSVEWIWIQVIVFSHLPCGFAVDLGGLLVALETRCGCSCILHHCLPACNRPSWRSYLMLCPSPGSTHCFSDCPWDSSSLVNVAPWAALYFVCLPTVLAS